MGKKHSSTAKTFIICIFAFEFMGITAEICQKIDECSCTKESNGKVINLKAIDGGSKPAFKDIPTVHDTQYTFDWNPCTKFSEGQGSECNNMLMCQKKVGSTEINPCAQTATDFRVNDDGSITIIYQPYTDSTGYKRTVEILLKCDGTQYPGNTGDGVTEFFQVKNSAYSMTFTSKCACDDGCPSQNDEAESRLSIGSILLIVFFVLLFVYLIAGILVKKYKMGVESMPEMVPNYEFWAGMPSLVKDGIVFTGQGIKSGCIALYGKCSNDGYGKV